LEQVTIRQSPLLRMATRRLKAQGCPTRQRAAVHGMLDLAAPPWQLDLASAHASAFTRGRALFTKDLLDVSFFTRLLIHKVSHTLHARPVRERWLDAEVTRARPRAVRGRDFVRSVGRPTLRLRLAAAGKPACHSARAGYPHRPDGYPHRPDRAARRRSARYLEVFWEVVPFFSTNLG
jgi:hypothetical protein